MVFFDWTFIPSCSCHPQLINLEHEMCPWIQVRSTCTLPFHKVLLTPVQFEGLLEDKYVCFLEKKCGGTCLIDNNFQTVILDLWHWHHNCCFKQLLADWFRGFIACVNWHAHIKSFFFGCFCLNQWRLLPLHLFSTVSSAYRKPQLHSYPMSTHLKMSSRALLPQQRKAPPPKRSTLLLQRFRLLRPQKLMQTHPLPRTRPISCMSEGGQPSS